MWKGKFQQLKRAIFHLAEAEKAEVKCKMSSWTFGSRGKSIVYFFRNIFLFSPNSEFYDYLAKIKIISKTLSKATYTLFTDLTSGKPVMKIANLSFRGIHVVIFYELEFANYQTSTQFLNI